jgi:hypothetical protein
MHRFVVASLTTLALVAATFAAPVGEEKEKSRSDPAGVPVDIKVVLKKDTIPLDLGGKTFAEFKKALDEAKKTGKYPAATAVDLDVVFTNTSDRDITLQFGGDANRLDIEVHKRIPILVIDGGFPDVDGEYSDTRCIKTALSVAMGYDVTPAGVGALEETDLSAFPSVFLLNVPKIESKKGLKNLEDYVKKGGRIAFFLGDRVIAQEYNKKLYDDGKGIFPVPLAARPTDKPKKEEREDMMMDRHRKILIRKPDHEAMSGLSLPEVQMVLRYLMVDQYFPTLPRSQWADKAEDIELATLPSRKEIKDYSDQALELYKKLPLENGAAPAKYEKYITALKRHRDNMRKALAEGKYIYELANALDDMLSDAGDPDKKDPKRPNLKDEFWQLPEQRELRGQFNALLDTVRYGDPLVVDKRFGKGHVVAVLTSASTRWNEWAGGSLVSFTFPLFVIDLEKYLTGGDVKGPGAISAETQRAFTREFRAPKPVAIAPGKSHTIELKGLKYGFRGVSHQAYLTEPGEYTITAVYATAVSPAPKDAKDAGDGYGAVKLTSAPVKLKVDEKK